MYLSASLSALLLALPRIAVGAQYPITIPKAPASGNVVQSNFLGISFELSYLDQYFGNNTKTMPPTVLNYLVALRMRTGENPIRIRVGGNSMDISTYIESQTSPMIERVASGSNSDYQPVNYGPMVWDVLHQVSSDVGGAAYLIGLSLKDPNNPTLPVAAGDAGSKLGTMLDGFLLGNEPDLYTKPNVKNYTTALYIEDFKTGSNHLTSTSAGNIPSKHELGGPTICCAWDLHSLIDDGFTSAFDSELKYISLQHYPQNNCGATHPYQLSYYIEHPNAVSLAKWQINGIQKVLSLPGGKSRPQLIMSEFNSAACGGIPAISDTFAVGSLWTVDYALQMASIGYTAAYIHTRERGVTYNLFTAPNAPSGSSGNWTTNPTFYGLLATAEALSSPNGNMVVDLNIANSMNSRSATVSGYAILDAADSTVNRLVFFNYADTSSSSPSYAQFVLPANTFPKATTVTVKYLVGNSLTEKKNIGFGGQTFANVGDGRIVSSKASWAPPNDRVECSKGCTIRVPSPGMAIVSSSTESDKMARDNAILVPLAAMELASSAGNASWDKASYVATILMALLATIFISRATR